MNAANEWQERTGRVAPLVDELFGEEKQRGFIIHDSSSPVADKEQEERDLDEEGAMQANSSLDAQREDQEERMFTLSDVRKIWDAAKETRILSFPNRNTTFEEYINSFTKS